MLMHIPVMTVDLADQFSHKVLVPVEHVVIFYRIHIDDQIQLRCLAQSHGGSPAFKQDPLLRNIRNLYLTLRSFLDLQRTALEQINGILPAFRQVNGKFGIHRIIIFLLDAGQHPLHLFHQGLIGHQPLAGDEFYIPDDAHIVEPVLRVIIMFKEDPVKISGDIRLQSVQGKPLQTLFVHVNDFRLALRESVLIG